jgi:rfaE bifunctional protein kinase chain/domain
MENIDKYSVKIVDLKKLKKKIGSFPRSKKVILCHGVFDIVHPGHIRHLAFAKSKADILVVSITADRHIKKGVYRPHVPERLRAMNLSLFEIVDYVLIDQNATPIQNLEKIIPDFYAKGYEYSQAKFANSATTEELKVLKKIGSKIVFTPGDIVYSSSKILNNSLPNLKYEKLNELIKQNKTNFKQIKNDLASLKDVKVHVIGDTIIDTYTQGKSIGGQTKTPTLSIKINEEKNYLGGAGIVSRHLKKAGANVFYTTIIGKDKLGKFTEKELKKDQIKHDLIKDESRPTINKNVVVVENHRLIKLDKVENHPISQNIIDRIIKNIKNIKTDIIIFSDFRHGIFNETSIKQFIKAVPKNILKVADSQVASRWGNIIDFKNFDLVTPNEREARFSTGEQDISVQGLIDSIKFKSKSKNIILKLGDRGVLCINDKKKYFSIDSFTDYVVDPVGAGDALLSYASLVYFKTRSLFKSAFIGSVAAACECEYDGNIPVSKDKIVEKFTGIEKKLSFKE